MTQMSMAYYSGGTEFVGCVGTFSHSSLQYTSISGIDVQTPDVLGVCVRCVGCFLIIWCVFVGRFCQEWSRPFLEFFPISSNTRLVSTAMKLPPSFFLTPFACNFCL